MTTDSELIEVTRTYLEMADFSHLNGERSNDPLVRIENIRGCTASFFRYLYMEVGGSYHWVDRRGWSDEEIKRYLAQSKVSIWLMTYDGVPAGYFELVEHEDNSVEIAYFGLIPEFIGRGLGKHLLTSAVKRGRSMGANRIWLHTCTLDGPAALPNYLKRGFRPYKKEKYYAKISERNGLIREQSQFTGSVWAESKAEVNCNGNKYDGTLGPCG